MTKPFRSALHITLAASCLTLYPCLGKADAIVSLNDHNLRGFVESMNNIATEKSGGSPEDLTRYLTAHLADDGQFNILTHERLADKPGDKSESFNKAQYIADVAQKRESMGDYTGSLDIKDIDIAKDGRSAKLKAVTTGKGTLYMHPGGDGPTMGVPFQKTSSCEETIILSATQLLQLQKATCETTIARNSNGPDSPAP